MNRNSFKLRQASSYVAMVLVALATPSIGSAQTAAATASSAPESDTADIVVTGFRASLASAIETKRAGSSILDSISAEDIGKFPEQNLAESLQRITGVQITRSRGEGANISIRGLSPDFNQINFNGRSIPSAGGSRSFDFTILSAELINGIDVYKSPTADLIEGGLAGSVNVRTLSPFDVTKTRLVVNAEGLYESIPKEVGPHISGLFATRLLDDRLSIVLGADYSRRKLRVDKYEAFGLETGVENQRNPQQDYNRDGDFNDTFLFNHAANFESDLGVRDRRTVLVAVGYDINDQFKVWGEGLYSRFDDRVKQTSLQYTRFTNILTPNAVQSSKVGANNILTFLDVDGVDNRAFGGGTTDNLTKLKSYAGGFKYADDRFKLSAQASYGSSKLVQNGLTMSIFTAGSVSEDLSIDPTGPVQLVNQRGFNPATANWRIFGLTGPYNSPTSDEIWETRADASYDLRGGFLKSIDAGVYYANRRRSFTSINLTANADRLAPLLGETYDPNFYGGTFAATNYILPLTVPNYLSAYNGPVKLPTASVIGNLDAVFQRAPLSTLLATFGTTTNLPSTYSVREISKAAYIRVNFGTLDSRLTGNVGVRVVNTDFKTNGFAPDLSLITFNQQGAETIVPGVTPSTLGRKYTNWLPSANVKFDINPDIVVRFAAARSLSRPRLDVLSPSTNINANVTTIFRGNPNVKPYKSDQFDLALEWYIAPGALLSGSVFYKHVTGFIVDTTSTLTLNVKDLQGGASRPVVFTVRQPDNGGSSNVRGFEIGYQQPLTFLPGFLNRFGVIANYTYVKGDDVPIVAGGAPIPLPGISKNNYNLVAYYEHAGLDVRASYNFRDRFVVDSSSYFGDGQYTSPFKQLDLSASYQVTPHFDVHLDVLNVLNEPLVNVDKYGINRGFEDNGRRVTAGVRFTL